MLDNALPLNMILEQVSRDKGIDTKILIDAIEAAILTAAKRSFGQDRELEARFNQETGVVDLFQYMIVVEEIENSELEVSYTAAKKAKLEAQIGEELGFQVFYRDEDEKKAKKQDKEFGRILGLQTFGRGFGRIAAQTAKQVIIQRVRDAEREIIFNEYKDRKNEVIAGIVRRFERNNDIIVDLGRAEGVIPYREQTPRESYRPGDRVMAFVKDIDREARGPQIILSRTDVGLLNKLFEMEVPEIYEGIVSIVTAAREPGARSKIAVASRDFDVDPVGACVGMRGSRVQSVVQELRGEKIDIVPWDRDAARFVCNAIQPAEVTRVIIDEANGSMELVVPDDKLSLAIGRRGQNVRLASQLTEWRLDVVSVAKFEEREAEAIETLAMIDGIDEGLAKSMYKLGFRTIEEVAEADAAELAGIPGFGGLESATVIQTAANHVMEELRQQRIRELVTREGTISQRERMLFVSGIGERTVELLAESGYRTLESIVEEEDIDHLALSTGLGIHKARHITQGAQQFLDSEEITIEELRKEAFAIKASEEKIEEASDTETATDESDATEKPEESTEEESTEEKTEEASDTETATDESDATEKPEESTEEKNTVNLDQVDEDW
jgi:transcription termination/antitermination protein NusA